MPGTRRTVSRLQANVPQALFNKSKPYDAAVSTSTTEEKEMGVTSSMLVVPRHAHVPDIPMDSNVIFEALMFMFSLVSLGLQYINLYRTVWWLPHSHAKYALNFYLIDPYLTLFLVVLMSRRLVWCFVKEVFGGGIGSCCYWLVQLIKLCVTVVMVSAFFWSAYHVFERHTLLYVLYLAYPLITYVILFGFAMKPFFSKSQANSTTPTGVPTTPTSAKSTPKREKPKDMNVAVSGNIPVTHACSTSPETVREEADLLKTDFNKRIKQVLFNSMVCAYYMGFIPLCFAQNTLYYDTWWVGQHVCLIWISAFVMFMVHYLPARYIDTLHRCALHLGRWVRVEGRNAHVPYNPWSELQVWQQGSLVKHVRGLFKSEGFHNSAEPGNGMHARFYFMFQQPLRVTNWLLVVTWGLVLYQFVLLITSIEWSHILALALLLFFNYYMLFKLMRGRLILSRAYKDEQLTMSQ